MKLKEITQFFIFGWLKEPLCSPFGHGSLCKREQSIINVIIMSMAMLSHRLDLSDSEFVAVKARIQSNADELLNMIILLEQRFLMNILKIKWKIENV